MSHIGLEENHCRQPATLLRPVECGQDGLEIVSVGNGNPRGFDSFKDVSSHPLYYGQAMVIVRRTRKNGKITLAATADGLRMAKLSLGF